MCGLRPKIGIPLSARRARVDRGTSRARLEASRVQVLRRCIVREVPRESRHGVTAVYLIQNTQYQFFDRGVLYIRACRGRLALNQLWARGGQHG